jgi:hypothetical protein
MESQWQPSHSPDGYSGPSFRKGRFLASANKDETQIRWHLYRISSDESLERLWSAESVQNWNAAESVNFPLRWADDMLVQAGWS